MDEGTERTGLFAKGGVGRFALGVTLGAVFFFSCACGLVVGVAKLASAGFRASSADDWGSGWRDGRRFADGRTITDCVREIERRAPSECANLVPLCGMTLSAFTGSCIFSATDDGYCAAVPDTSEPGASSEWKRSACAVSPGRWCDAAMRDIQSACHLRNQRAADDATTPDAPEPE